jgi:cytochrome c peroxidase
MFIRSSHLALLLLSVVTGPRLGAATSGSLLSPSDEAKVLAFLKPITKDQLRPKDKGAEARIALGKKLFTDTALSNPAANKGEKVSCNTCHLLDKFGVDGIDRSVGVMGEKVPVNAPTVYNAALHVRQFWDGRAADVEEQALGPITALKEMGFSNSKDDEKVVLNQLEKADPSYPKLFAAAFPSDMGDSFNFKNIGKAIGAFERTLLTPSKFDSFLSGKKTALNDREVEGLKVFLNFGNGGCVSCHNGPALGGAQFRALGEQVRAPEANDSIAAAVFKDVPAPLKVPSLRNIEKTGPYFHNGSVASLDEAIEFMAYYQLGKKISGKEKDDLKAFLATLTGSIN